MIKFHNALLAGSAFAALFASAANATDFNIQSGDLGSALNAYMQQSGVVLIVSGDAVKGIKTRGVRGELAPDAALSRLLSGTGFSAQPNSGVIAIVRDGRSSEATGVQLQPMQLAQAAPSRAAVETVTVTSSKLGGADVQSIPIAITAMSQEQLTATQTAGGPDLVKQVPNLTFTKTNFTGYSIQIRGIGTQAISVATDPAVAVALNDIPFIRNHFFEQEFYDLSQAEVLRGPQGTLYGRNATAGVVNLTTARPTDQFEALASADIGNYKNHRFEGMINLPIVDDRVALRIAGEWTKRNGYTTNEITGNPVDGRDLWSSRVTLAWKPLQNLQTYLVWEHFQENDDRMRTAKQLCHTDRGLSSVTVNGTTYNLVDDRTQTQSLGEAFQLTQAKFSQGCLPASMYSPESFQVPNGFSLPYVIAGYVSGAVQAGVDPYAQTTQSPSLRVIQTQIDPRYKSKNDTLEFNADYNVTPLLTFTSQTGFNADYLWSTEDYNRFNTTPDLFVTQPNSPFLRTRTIVTPDGNYRCFDGVLSVGGNQCSAGGHGGSTPTGIFCDPQLGCSSRLVAQDISREHAWQMSQEFRLTSNFSGPLNFSAGGNFLHYETVEDYYVFANTLTLYTTNSGSIINGPAWVPGVSDNHECFDMSSPYYSGIDHLSGGQYNDPNQDAGQPTSVCYAIDPNPLSKVDDAGHNYFLSRNPYLLNSYAGFGEAYYNLFEDLKLTGGIRWTSDHKHFTDIPSELLAFGQGYQPIGAVDQSWNQLTGRAAANWTPKLDFTDQTLIYGSWAHGYKAGGANPPGPVLGTSETAGVSGVPVHPLTFEPEFVNAYELGTKNTLLDGSLTLNGDVFYYNYTGYQISEIVDRTAINLNFNATVKGAELEATYEPLPGLKFKFAGGYEKTRIKDGQSAVDLMDRTAGHAGWVVMKPFVTQPSNCVVPEYVVAALLLAYPGNAQGSQGVSACGFAYGEDRDPVTLGFYHYNNGSPYYVDVDPFTGEEQVNGVHHPYPVTYGGLQYTGFDPLAGTAGDPYVGQNTFAGVDYGPVPNGGNGFSKNLSGHELPNAPRFTVSASTDYTVPLSSDWAGTIHVDYYWQDYSWARVFNDNPYDRIRGYTNVNLALILTSQDGWQVMGYLKNVFDTTAITGTFLNSDDSGLTTNVFLTDPRLFGVRVTKNW